ncbi:MAG TPA: hypothetical protein VFD97_02940 [Acidimicrobiia bacterium]|nr:hypothetical protein [Acidimicrobiia bacterium]
MSPKILVFVAAALIAASCTSSNEPAASTTTSAPPTSTTTTMVPLSTTTSSTTTTSLPAPTPVFPEFRITERIVAPETGDIVVLLLDPASYTSLSDLDIYEVIADAVDRFPPIFEVYVVDTEAAAAAVLVEAPDEGQQQELAAHYLARLEDGFRIVYVGPFEDSGVAVLGS